MTDQTTWQVDAVVIGAGPAGCSTALWLSEMGIAVALIEKSSGLLTRLAALQLPQNWVLGAPRTLTSDLAQRYAAHIQAQPGIRIALDDAIAQTRRLASGGWLLVTQAGRTIEARAAVIATGLQPLTFGACSGPGTPLDASKLAHRRTQLPAGRFLLLGGGDNAIENAVYLARAGHAVTLWSRGPLRAQHHLLAQLDELPQDRLTLRVAQPMPERLVSLSSGHDNTGAWKVGSAAYGAESFDYVAVLFGNVPDDAVPRLFAQAAGSGNALPDGVFVAGDLSGRWHPCASTAIADGVQAAKQVQHWLDHAAIQPNHADALTPLPPPGAGLRSLSFTGLRFKAALGILKQERDAPQPIQVDAQLNLGRQPLHVGDDDIARVLDYRRVRQTIIDECTARHVNLLETLVGKLCMRLLQLPGVQGARVKITKLEIFDDCEVAICMEAGSWS